MNIEKEILNVAIVAAKKGGEILLPYYEMIGQKREQKDDKSFVSEADLNSEKAILKIIQDKFPDHGILAEEGGETENLKSPYRWIIDPLDGTANFLNGIPIFGVSIGVYENNMPLVGVVLNPITGELYNALRGDGAFYNGKKVKVSDQKASEGLVTFGLSKEKSDKEHFTKTFLALEKVFNKRRHLGATAIEMGFIARGGVEATISFGSKLWDHAAGAVLILEAGGKITDFEGNPWVLGETHFVASNGVCHDDILKILNDN